MLNIDVTSNKYQSQRKCLNLNPLSGYRVNNIIIGRDGEEVLNDSKYKLMDLCDTPSLRIVGRFFTIKLQIYMKWTKMIINKYHRLHNPVTKHWKSETCEFTEGQNGVSSFYGETNYASVVIYNKITSKI